MSEMTPQFESITTGKLIQPSLPEATYEPKSFKKLWLWFAWLIGVGAPLLFICIGIFPLIAGTIIGFVLLYRFWHVIQDGGARTTPGRAVGYCFIPFYNLYWITVAIIGLAEDMNKYCNERNIAGIRVSKKLATLWCILILAQIITNFCFNILQASISKTAGTIDFATIVFIILTIFICIAEAATKIILYKQFADAAACIMEMKKSQAKTV